MTLTKERQQKNPLLKSLMRGGGGGLLRLAGAKNGALPTVRRVARGPFSITDQSGEKSAEVNRGPEWRW